jgi:hypothetical protein
MRTKIQNQEKQEEKLSVALKRIKLAESYPVKRRDTVTTTKRGVWFDSIRSRNTASSTTKK